MNGLLISVASYVVAPIVILCGLLLDIAILFRWRYLPKTFSIGYRVICLLGGLLAIYSGLMFMVIHQIAIKP